jgi:hypothetical protein
VALREVRGERGRAGRKSRQGGQARVTSCALAAVGSCVRPGSVRETLSSSSVSTESGTACPPRRGRWRCRRRTRCELGQGRSCAGASGPAGTSGSSRPALVGVQVHPFGVDEPGNVLNNLMWTSSMARCGRRGTNRVPVPRCGEREHRCNERKPCCVTARPSAAVTHEVLGEKYWMRSAHRGRTRDAVGADGRRCGATAHRARRSARCIRNRMSDSP